MYQVVYKKNGILMIKFYMSEDGLLAALNDTKVFNGIHFPHSEDQFYAEFTHEITAAQFPDNNGYILKASVAIPVPKVVSEWAVVVT